MADRPIIFSAPMIQALLDGRKSQTRRLIDAPGLFGWHVDRVGPTGWQLTADGGAPRIPWSRALRLLGNGVHPLAAGHAWRTLSSAHGLRPLDLVAASAEDGAGTDGALVMADQWGGWAEAQEAAR